MPQAYTGNLASSTGENAKQIKTPMKLYKVDDEDLISVQRF